MWAVITYRVESDGRITETGYFGPFMDEASADSWVDVFYNLCKYHEPKAKVETKIIELENPYTFGITPELRTKLFGF